MEAGMTLGERLRSLRPHIFESSTLVHALRTALAATVTAVLTRLLHLEQGYWAVFSSILVMQANFGSSIAASWARLLGTGAGALLGALAATAADALLGQGLGTIAAAMFVTIFFCALLAAKNENLRLAGLTAAVVICLHTGAGTSAFSLGLSRFVEVSLGIVVALGVSLAWPARARVIVRHGLAKGLERLASLLAVLMESRLSGEYLRQRIFHEKDAVLRLALRNRQLLASARREPGPSGQGEALTALLASEERLAEHLLAMDHAIEHAPAEGFHKHLPEELGELGASLATALLALAAALSGPDLSYQSVDPSRDPAGQPDPSGQQSGQPLPSAALERVDAALDAAGAKLLDLRQQRIIAIYDLDEVMHFYAFYHALREAAREADALAEALPRAVA